MATNEVYRAGTKISLPVPETIKAGAPVRVGAINAVAQTDAGVTGPPVVPGGVGNAPGYASVARDGAFNLSVTGALTIGQIVYIITATNLLTATSTGNKIFGVALSAKGAGVGNAIVELVQPGTNGVEA